MTRENYDRNTQKFRSAFGFDGLTFTGDYDKDYETATKFASVMKQDSLATRDYVELHIALGETAANAYIACEFAHAGPGLYLLPSQVSDNEVALRIAYRGYPGADQPLQVVAESSDSCPIVGSSNNDNGRAYRTIKSNGEDGIRVARSQDHDCIVSVRGPGLYYADARIPPVRAVPLLPPRESCVTLVGTAPQTFRIKTKVTDDHYNEGSGVPPGTTGEYIFRIEEVTKTGDETADFKGYITSASDVVTGKMNGKEFEFTDVANANGGIDTRATTPHRTFCVGQQIIGEMKTISRTGTLDYFHRWDIVIER